MLDFPCYAFLAELDVKVIKNSKPINTNCNLWLVKRSYKVTLVARLSFLFIEQLVKGISSTLEYEG